MSVIYKEGVWYGKGGSDITVDSAISAISENPVQNKVIKEALDGKADLINAGDGIVIDNGEISTDNMPSEDMSEVISPLPSIKNRRFKYSTEEQIVGEWIDGRPVYQKTIEFGELPNNSTKNVAHNISNLERVIGYNTSFIRTTDNLNIFLNHISGTGTNTLYDVMTVNTTNIVIKSLNDVSNISGYVTLQYIKTTD